MVIRGIVSAFLLSSVAVLSATSVWGNQALVPFTVGELAGALFTLLTLGSSVSMLLRPPRKKVRAVLDSDIETEVVRAPNPIRAHVFSQAPSNPIEVSAGLRAEVRREGQISPYFPGIRAWSYLSCPPSHHNNRKLSSRVEPATADVIVLDYGDLGLVSERFGLLPEHVSIRPRSVS